MSKSIYQLIPDIQGLLKTKGWFNASLGFEREIGSRLDGQFGQGSTNSRTGKLRLSQLGPRCPRALWYSIYHPELAEKLPPWTEFKYSFGHIIEGLAIALAKASGHEVTGEQDELELDGIVGHRDCIIDGCLVDIKSASSPSFKKFEDGSIKESDSFGYLDQLDGYLLASADDPLLRVKDKAWLLAVDKQLGHMCLYEHRLTDVRERTLRNRIAAYKQVVSRDSPPRCTCGTIADGESGNQKLDLKASYNVHKHQCFPELRTFVYSKGPVYFTEVRKTPKFKGIPLQEIDKHGNPVFT